MFQFDAPGLNAALHHRSAIVEAQRILTAAGLYAGLVPHWEDLGRQTIDLFAARRAFDAVGCETPGTASRMQPLLARSIFEALTRKFFDQFVFGSGVTEKERQSPRVLEALVAQFVGGVTHLGGLNFAVKDLLIDALPINVEVSINKDPKNLVQELYQANKRAVPTYLIVDVTGVGNQQTFEACIDDKSGKSSYGKGPSKRIAEKNAARQFLVQHFPRVAVDVTTKLRFHPDVRLRASSIKSLPNFHNARQLTEQLGMPSWATPLNALAFIHPSCEGVSPSSIGRDYRLLAFLGSHVVAWGIRDHCIRTIKGEELDASGGLTAVALSVLSKDGILKACEWLFQGELHCINQRTTKENSNIFTEMMQALMSVLFLARESNVCKFTDVVRGVSPLEEHLSSADKRIKPRSQTFASKTMLQERLQSIGIQFRFQSEYTTEGGLCSIRPIVRMQSPHLPDAMNVRGVKVVSAVHESRSMSQHEEVLANKVSEIYDSTLGLTSESDLFQENPLPALEVRRWLLEHMAQLVERASAMPIDKQVVRLFALQPLGMRYLIGKEFASFVLWLRRTAGLLPFEEFRSVLLRFYVLAGHNAGRSIANGALLKCLDGVSELLKRADPLCLDGVTQKDAVFQAVIDHAIAHRIASGVFIELKIADLVDQCNLFFRDKIEFAMLGDNGEAIVEKSGAHLALFNLLFETFSQSEQRNLFVRATVEGEYLMIVASASGRMELLERLATRPLWHTLYDFLAIRDVEEIDGQFSFSVASVITDQIASLALESWWTVHSGGALNAAADGVIATVLHDMKNELLAYFSAASQARQSEVFVERYRLAASASRHIERAEVHLGIVRTLLASSITRESQSIDLAAFFRRVNAETLEWMPVGVHFSVPPVLQDSYVVSNEKALRSVIVNLIRNAVEALEDGVGHIGLEYLLDENDRTLEIEVTDDGPGFSVEQLEALNFGMPIESSKRNGSGIGLLTVLLLVHELGGKVKFNTKVNGGSCILLRIPSGAFSELEPLLLDTDLESYQEVNVQ